MIKNIFAPILLFAVFSSTALATTKEKVVFLVNTKEHDIRGAVTTPELDEYADTLNWQQIAPDATILRIRANTNEELKKGLEFYMGPNPDTKEVVGLFIRSHGLRQLLYNEQETFYLHIPKDIPTVFHSVRNHFSANARIVFNGCSVLEGMNVQQAEVALQNILDALGMKTGVIYANRTVGYEAFETFPRVSIFNKDIPLLQRTIAGVFYIAWPVTVPLSYTMKKAFNRGYILIRTEDGNLVYKTDYYSALQPQL